MSITEALEAVKKIVAAEAGEAWGLVSFSKEEWATAIETAKDAIHVLEAYIQEKEGQGGLGL